MLKLLTTLLLLHCHFSCIDVSFTPDMSNWLLHARPVSCRPSSRRTARQYRHPRGEICLSWHILKCPNARSLCEAIFVRHQQKGPSGNTNAMFTVHRVVLVACAFAPTSTAPPTLIEPFQSHGVLQVML